MHRTVFALFITAALGVLSIASCSAEDPSGLSGGGRRAGRSDGGVSEDPSMGENPEDPGEGTDPGNGTNPGGGGSDGGTGSTGGAEQCDNGRDDDGDGQVDENCPCMPGTMQRCSAAPGTLAGVGACSWGTQRCEGSGEFGSWSACTGAGLPAMEVCDRVDNDCDGMVDEGCGCSVGETRPCYPGPAGTENVGVCRAGNQRCIADGSGRATWGPCEGAIVPSPDRCDGRDNDCDGRADNSCLCPLGMTRSCYSGRPGTLNVGACRAGTQQCNPRINPVTHSEEGSDWGPCMGEVLPSGERCDDRVDNDCDGTTDCMDSDCAGSAACTTCMPGGQRFDLTSEPVEVIFVTDRSGSMSTPISGGVTRWQALRNAVDAVLPGLDRTHYMGLFIFPSSGSCGVNTAPDVPVSQPSAARISAALAAGGPSGATPTTEMLRNVEAYMVANPSPRRRYLVLATDGAPNCSGNVSTTVSQIAGIRSRLGVDTFVLGIPGGDATLRDALNQMAVAGGRPRPGSTQFYEASSASDLEAALRAIAAGTISCTFRLSSRPMDPSRVTVTFDGRTVPRDPANGWDYTDGTYTSIRFNGTACMQLQSGSVRTIQASFNC